MNVTLLAITPNAEELIEKGARVCYNSNENPETRKQFIQSLIKRGHEGCIEHGVATFKIEGVSRALTHQLVRHRLASYLQRSQRYVKEKGFEYVVPDSIKKHSHLRFTYEDCMGYLQLTYELLLKGGIPAEDARFILPNACCSELVMTMNFRALRHFLKLRLDKHAQWEIRELAKRILDILLQHAPSVFEDLISK
jgi:thymidylate synthase (FAD)